MEYRSNIHHEYDTSPQSCNMVCLPELTRLGKFWASAILRTAPNPQREARHGITCMAKVSNFSAAASLAMLLGKFRQAISRLDLGTGDQNQI